MKKWLFLLAASLVWLVVCGIKPVCAATDGEVSVLEKIGKDGDYLTTSLVAQRLSNYCSSRSAIASGDVAFVFEMENGFQIFELDENGIWHKKQAVQNPNSDANLLSFLSEDTAIHTGDPWDNYLYTIDRD
ncbi:MAG TPA: hypothetical protein VIM29_02155 [Bacillota bacterium]